MDSLDQFEIESIRAGERPFDDIEWFARDSGGHIGVFSTAGIAAIPIQALATVTGFNALHRQIQILPTGQGFKSIDRNQGMNPSFTAFADRGLFVYDWNHSAGQYRPNLPYRLVTEPLVPIAEGASALVGGLPEFPFLFSEVPDVIVESYFDALNL